MSKTLGKLPSLGARLAAGRPVLSQNDVTALNERILAMTSADNVMVQIVHTARCVTRMSNNQVLSGDDGDILWISISMDTGGKVGCVVDTNQLDDSVLRSIVQECERIARETVHGSEEDIRLLKKGEQDVFVPVQLWHDATVQAMTTARKNVVPELVQSVMDQQLNGSGFLGLMARSQSFMTKKGNSAYSEETDSEVMMTARSRDGKISGWGGLAARNWAAINPREAAARAMHIATLAGAPVAVEPGRRTAILSAAAVAQIMRKMSNQFEAQASYAGLTGFSRQPPPGIKMGQRVFDPRINMRSDPADPDGGYCPFFYSGLATPAMSWVENGVLKNLAYDPGYAMQRGKSYADEPVSIRVSGGTTSVEEMISRCEEGIYVNRFSSVERVDQKTGLMTGVTRDGCFLVKDGKIAKAVKNFRFLESPFFFLNKIEALGVPERTALGYVPPKQTYHDMRAALDGWPRPPIIAPPMMVHDFNFSALADAV